MQVEARESLGIEEVVNAAIEMNEPIEANAAKRRALIANYLKQ